MDVMEWLGEDNWIGSDIYEKKYRKNDESFEEWLDRISGGDEEVRQLIRNKKFLFGGRILSNRGLDPEKNKYTLSNCYVLPPPEDNLEGIYDTASKLARTFSYGGGVGVDVSKLRPKGAKVNNTAKTTTGAVSFMELFDATTGLIGQGGRIGALMLSMSANHPDIEEFIISKEDIDKLNNCNISIRVDDDFMIAAIYDLDYELKFVVNETNEVITKKVKANALFRRLCEMNHKSAEPGILFWDRIKEHNMLAHDDNFSFAGVNPCFAGDMELLTADGYKTFEELCGTEPYIYNVNGNVVKSKVWCSGEKETVKIKTTNGEIICTPDHRFMTADGNECMAKNLKGKYIMPYTCANKTFDERYVKYGFIQGDGQLNRLNSSYHNGIEVNIGVKDTDIYDLFSNEEYSNSSDRKIYLQGFKEDLLKLGFFKNKLPDREFPSSYGAWDKLQKASFLHGCYSANGSVIKKGRISYKTACKRFAEQLADTLLNDFDIHGVYITTNKQKKIKFTNGEYECRESYDVNIGRYKEITKFIAEINFYQQYKREQLNQMMRNRSTHVYNVEPYKSVKVYDFEEPERHWGVVEGYIVHNCAEEPLPAGGSCLLGAINLSEFVKKSFTNDSYFDWKDFKNTVKIAVKALNDVLDEGLELHPLEIQRKTVADWRQIGLGIMGLSDCLIKLGKIYGSKDAIDFCEHLSFTLFKEAVLVSEELGGRYGSYNKYNRDDINESEMIKKIGVTTNHLRNSQLLTIAPTGTISTMLGVSGGIEPIFANSYIRKTKSLHNKDVEYKVFTPIVKEYMELNGITDEADLPNYFVTAKDIPYKERIAVQAAWQKWIDASISSTINLPESATVEDIEDIYMTAWKSGLKGVTIYRDGCDRAPILDDDKNRKNGDTHNDAPDAPGEYKRGFVKKSDDSSIGVHRRLVTGCGTLWLHIYFDRNSGDLIECFVSKGSAGGCGSSLVGLSRMVSLALRGGVSLDDVVDQLKSADVCESYKRNKEASKGRCCPSAIGYALVDANEEMKHIFAQKESKPDSIAGIKKEESDGEVNGCPHCGELLVHEGGCVQCISCGWSRCG